MELLLFFQILTILAYGIFMKLINRVLVLSIILVCVRLPLKAQVTQNFPIDITQFFNNYYLVNPAGLYDQDKLTLAMGNRSLTGLFQGVSHNYFDVDLCLDKKNFDRIGLVMFSKKEGGFIFRNRAYLRYNRTIQTEKGNYLSLGAAAGVVLHQFRATKASAGGSDIAPDFNLGLWYQVRNMKIGASVQQVLEPSLQPIADVYKAYRYYNLMANWNAELSSDVQLELHALGSYQLKQPINTYATVLVNYRQNLDAGLLYKQTKGVSFLAGLNDRKVGAFLLDFNISYLVLNTYKIVSTNDAALEISLQARIN